MELRVGEGRVYGAVYYTVWPKFYAHAETWFRSDWNKMTEWCENTYGPTPEDGIWTPGARWYANDGGFLFRNEDDSMMFVLRWS
jgi:hypothetical protein